MAVALQIVILAHPDSGSTNSSFANLISTSCLVRYDLCELESLSPEDDSLKLELRQSDGTWRRMTILVQSATGWVQLRYDDDQTATLVALECEVHCWFSVEFIVFSKLVKLHRAGNG